MTTTDAVPLKTLDPAHVSRVVRALLIEADRDILVEDGPRRDLVSIPFDAAAAEDGLLPVFLVAARGDLARRHRARLRTRAEARSRRAHVVADRGDPGRGLLLRPPVGHGGDRGGRGRSRGDGAGSGARVRRGDGAHRSQKGDCVIGAAYQSEGRSGGEGDSAPRRRSRRWRSRLRSSFRRKPMRR